MVVDPHRLSREIDTWPNAPLWNHFLYRIARDGLLFREIDDALAERDRTVEDLVALFRPQYFFLTWSDQDWHEQVKRRLEILARLGIAMRWGDIYQLVPKKRVEIAESPETEIEGHRDRTSNEQNAVLLLREFERRLRKYIEKRLRQGYGDDWWARGVPEEIQRTASEERLRRPLPERGPDCRSLDFLSWSHYLSIICSKKNWPRIFERDLKDKARTSFCLTGLASARNALYHVRGIDPETVSAIPYFVKQIDSCID